MRNEQEKLLVLLAGQSNMAGRGYAEPEDLTTIPNLLMIRPDGKWQAAIEPITKDRNFVGTFSASGEKVMGQDPFETRRGDIVVLRDEGLRRRPRTYVRASSCGGESRQRNRIDTVCGRRLIHCGMDARRRR